MVVLAWIIIILHVIVLVAMIFFAPFKIIYDNLPYNIQCIVDNCGSFLKTIFKGIVLIIGAFCGIAIVLSIAILPWCGLWKYYYSDEHCDEIVLFPSFLLMPMSIMLIYLFIKGIVNLVIQINPYNINAKCERRQRRICRKIDKIINGKKLLAVSSVEREKRRWKCIELGEEIDMIRQYDLGIIQKTRFYYTLSKGYISKYNHFFGLKHTDEIILKIANNRVEAIRINSKRDAYSNLQDDIIKIRDYINKKYGAPYYEHKNRFSMINTIKWNNKQDCDKSYNINLIILTLTDWNNHYTLDITKNTNSK